MLPHPPACRGCPLDDKLPSGGTLGFGFSPASENLSGKILFLAEALGAEEAALGDNLVGAAGAFFDRQLERNSISRAANRLENVIKCRPPQNFLRGSPWEQAAISHCTQAYLEPGIDRWLKAGGKVVVPMGAVPLRYIFNGVDIGSLNNWHGTVSRDPTDRFWVVPTYHPSFLQRGAWNLTMTQSADLQEAADVALNGHPPDPAQLWVDPPYEWFCAWADQYIARAHQDPEKVWLSVDIETPDKAGGKDEGELTAKDRSYEILRINFSANLNEGITVPFVYPYTIAIRRVLIAPGPKCFWNWIYDVRRLKAAGFEVSQPIWDWMWGWHLLQSDVPRGLGFVSPSYSGWGPWKHRAYGEPGPYAAIDPLQTTRCGYGIAKDLVNAGQWETFLRHVWKLEQTILIPSVDIGLLIDEPELDRFDQELQKKREEIFGELQQGVPEALLPLEPKQGLQDDPGELPEPKPEEEIQWRPLRILKKELTLPTQCCLACGSYPVVKKHRCKDEKGKPRKDVVAELVVQDKVVPRWYRQLPFNPNSPPQILALIKHKGLKPGRQKYDKNKETTDKDTLEKLKEKDPYFGTLLSFRSVTKVQGTYVRGVKRRLADQRSLGVMDGRIHATYTDKPSTWRKSMVNPNLQNVVGDKTGKKALAAGFKRCVIAAPGAKLVEVDYASIEAVMTGYRMGSRDFVRLARLGIHSYIVGHEVGEPAKLSWSDQELADHFAKMKARYKDVYERCKRGVYQTLYGGTPVGLWSTFPKHFKSKTDAERFQALVFEVCPGLQEWQWKLRELAARQGFIGGKDHPFRYRHWFWKIFDYRRLKGTDWVADGMKIVEFGAGKFYRRYLGEDGKRVVAYEPQSIASGTLKESVLRLHDEDCPNYIGDYWYGKTPLRALVHDSNLGEVLDAMVQEYIRRVVLEMTRPVEQLPLDPSWGMGTHLSIGVDVKVGQNWLDKNLDLEKGPLNPEGMERVETAELQAEGSGLPAVWGSLAGDDTIEVDFEEGDEEDEYGEDAA